MTRIEAVELALKVAQQCSQQVMCCGCPFHDDRYECYVKLAHRAKGVELLEEALQEEHFLALNRGCK